ncbi:MAG TPA: hypothetical protein VFF79_12710 [Conexibacter sp.]|jgi:hypothetical protein|nr:hypothetical protein [Conexibacter sp.]
MPSLPTPIKALVTAAISAVGGGVAALVATRFPWIHLSRGAVTTDITFVLGAGITWLEHQKVFKLIEAKISRLLTVVHPIAGELKTLDPGIVSQLGTQVAVLTGRVETLLHLHAASITAAATANTTVRSSVTSGTTRSTTGTTRAAPATGR